MNKLFHWITSSSLPLWLAMLFAPYHPFTQRLARSTTVFGLTAVNYSVTLAAIFRQPRDEMRGAGMFTLDQVAALMRNRRAALAVWAQLVSYDLFVGAWIYRECLRLAAPAAVRVAALLLALLAGPLGLLFFLSWRIVGRGMGERLEEHD